MLLSSNCWIGKAIATAKLTSLGMLQNWRSNVLALFITNQMRFGEGRGGTLEGRCNWRSGQTALLLRKWLDWTWNLYFPKKLDIGPMPKPRTYGDYLMSFWSWNIVKMRCTANELRLIWNVSAYMLKPSQSSEPKYRGLHIRIGERMGE